MAGEDRGEVSVDGTDDKNRIAYLQKKAEDQKAVTVGEEILPVENGGQGGEPKESPIGGSSSMSHCAS